MRRKILRAIAAALIVGSLTAAATAPLAPPGTRSARVSTTGQ